MSNKLRPECKDAEKGSAISDETALFLIRDSARGDKTLTASK